MSGASQYDDLKDGLIGPNWSVSTVAARVERQTACSAEEAHVVAHAAKKSTAEEAADALEIDVQTLDSYAGSVFDQLEEINNILTPPYQ